MPQCVHPPFLYCGAQTLVYFAQFHRSYFYLLHTYLIKNPLQTRNPGAIMKTRKNISISFSFSYLSLFVDTPGSSGQRSRGSPFAGRDAPTGNACTAFYYSSLPFAARYRFIVQYCTSICGDAPTGNACIAGLSSLHLWVPLGIASLHDFVSIFCGVSPLTMRAQCGNNRFCPSPLGIASLCYLGATYCGDSPTNNACTAGL